MVTGEESVVEKKSLVEHWLRRQIQHCEKNGLLVTSWSCDLLIGVNGSKEGALRNGIKLLGSYEAPKPMTFSPKIAGSRDRRLYSQVSPGARGIWAFVSSIQETRMLFTAPLLSTIALLASTSTSTSSTLDRFISRSSTR